MAEVAVSFVCEKLISLVSNEGNLLYGVHKEFKFIKDELEMIRSVLKDADTKAAGERKEREGIKTWVKQLRETSFRIEDAVDEYLLYLAHHPPFPVRDCDCAALLPTITRKVKTLKNRHQIASEIADIKLDLDNIKKRGERYQFQRYIDEGSSSTENTYAQEDPRMASLFIEEAEVVGFEQPKRQLIDWLVGGEAPRTVISVTGMGGQGKTTLAKKVYDSQDVIDHFDFRAWIAVSQSYARLQLEREMMVQICKARRDSLPENLSGMGELTLVTEIRNHLQRIRYLVFFDDVWQETFWHEIEIVLPDNGKRSRVVVTTRKKDVAGNCNTPSPFVYELNPLSSEDSWELFCRKAFRAGSNGLCPSELIDISKEIIKRCEGLPLAIVTIAGLLATKKKTKDEWQKLHKNLSSELENNPFLSRVARILAFSYDDLPYYLKSCYLYFGIYPEDYAISCARLCKQWIAEGFVKGVPGKSLEEVAEGYLTELIHRSLVQVSVPHFEGNAKSCRIHDWLREIILVKIKDSSFSRFVYEDDQPTSDTITRRLSIATSSGDVLANINYVHIRAMYIFEDSKLPKSFQTTLSTKFMLLKVLDFEKALIYQVPDDLGKLFHLKYLSFRHTKIRSLPKSIGKLLNLETLDLRNTLVREIPSYIKKLTKLRHLLAYQHNNHITESSLAEENGVHIREGVGSLTSVQKLYQVQVNRGGKDLIRELARLRQLRKLGLKHVKNEYGETLCASLNVMKKLESLDISAANDEIIDLNSLLSPSDLRRLRLLGRLVRLPDWIPNLERLVKLTIAFSELNDDPLDALKHLPNLVDLSICQKAYGGEVLHFQEGSFQRLKNLFLESLPRVNSINIGNGALLVLEKFEIWSHPKLQVVPSGIRELRNLRVLDFADLPNEFNRSIDPDGGDAHNIIQHVPIVYIRTRGNLIHGFDIFETRTLRHPSHSERSNAQV